MLRRTLPLPDRRVVAWIVAAMLIAACRPVTAPAGMVGDIGVAPFRVALILHGGSDDLEWSQPMYDSLLALQTTMGPDALEVAVTDYLEDPAAASAAMRTFAAEGYDLVIAHSFMYRDAVTAIAPEFPGTSFAFSLKPGAANPELDNVWVYDSTPVDYAAGYLNGVAAGLLTKSGRVAIILDAPGAPDDRVKDGFLAGLAAARLAAEAHVVYAGSFEDNGQGLLMAADEIAGGADVLLGSADKVGAMVQAAADGGAYWLGTHSDNAPAGQANVVVSQVYNWAPVIEQMIAAHARDRLGGETLTLTVDEGGLVTAYNDTAAVPADLLATLKTALSTAAAGITDGSIAPGASK